MDNEQKKAMLKRLKAAAKQIDASIKALEATVVTGELPICPYCKLEIQPGENVRRECHDRCYQTAYGLVKTKETTWEKLESQGRVGKAGQKGRPSKAQQAVEDQMDAKNQRRTRRKRSGS